MNSLDVSRSVMASDPQVFREALGYLAKCQAEYQRLASVVSTTEPDSLRRALDDVARLRYEQDGIKSYEVKIGDKKVGTYTVRATKEEPERDVTTFVVDDPEAALRWLMEDRTDKFYKRLCDAAAEIAVDCMRETGELIESTCARTEHVPAIPSTFKNMVLKIDREKVENALMEAEAKQIEGSAE